MSRGYVDSDGHIMEKAEEFFEYFEEPWRSCDTLTPSRVVPSGDEFHTPRIRRKGIFDWSVGPEQWLEYLDKTGLEFTVLYTSAGLTCGHIVNPEWATVYARAWNNYVYEKYLKRSPRFKAMAVIPMQDVPAAVLETQAGGQRPRHGGSLPSLQRSQKTSELERVLAGVRGSAEARLRAGDTRRQL